jgi:hypothetical protein
MKIWLVTLVFVCSLYLSGFAQPKKETHNLLSEAYGFIRGQEYALDKIRSKYPALETEVKKSELAFSLSFGRAKDIITTKMKEMLGEEFQRFDRELIQQFGSYIISQDFTEEYSINFIKSVHERSKGGIHSPVLETLLTYQFLDFPAKEFTSGYTYAYSTRGHYKNKGVDINAKIPTSWEKAEGDRPNVIHKFVSENGKGKEVIMFMVKDLGLPADQKLSVAEVNEFFTEGTLKEVVPQGGEFISAKRIVIDNHTGGQIIFKLTAQRIDQTITTQAIHYITLYNNKLVFLQCMVAAKPGESLNDRFNLFLPLFRQVANSIVLTGQY